MKLIALNLPRDFDENALAALFKTHGNIKGCTLVMDEKTGKSKGFGFVEMPDAKEAKLAPRLTAIAAPVALVPSVNFMNGISRPDVLTASNAPVKPPLAVRILNF